MQAQEVQNDLRRQQEPVPSQQELAPRPEELTLVIDISPSRIFSYLKSVSRAVILAYLVLLALLLWTAEGIHRNRVSFFRDCETGGGVITWSDQTMACTRIRSGGMMQL